MSSPRGWGEPTRPSHPSSGGSERRAAGADGAPPAVPQAQQQPPPDGARAMGVGELMERVIGSIRAVPRSTWLVGAAVVVLVGVVELVAARTLPFGSVTDAVLGGAPGGEPWFDQAEQEVRLLANQALTSALTAVLGTVATTLVVGWTARAVALHDASLPHRARDVWRGLRPRVAGLLALVLLLSVVVLLALAVPVLLAVIASSTGSVGAVVAAGVVGLVASAALLVRFVPALVLSLPAQATATTGGAGAALRRAVRLTAGERWRLVGIWLLAVVVLGIAGGVVASPFTGIGAAVGGTAAPTWSLLGSVVASAVTAPLGALVLALVHGELEQRRGSPEPARA